MNLQPLLENDLVELKPLEPSDFESLYKVASDHRIWEQHPNPDRYKKDVFSIFFEGALQSKGAFKIINKTTKEIIGSTRFYDYNPSSKTVLIGYTFYARKYWSTGINHSVKKLMLKYAFQYIEDVIFHIGEKNLRSQISIERLGAIKIDVQEIIYFGEEPKINFIYKLSKTDDIF